jgi:hypothetical protein
VEGTPISSVQRSTITRMDNRQRRIARARLLRRNGKAYAEIRAVIGSVDDETLRRWCKGIPRPRETHRSHPKIAERRRARQLRMAGATYPEIGDQLGVAQGSLSVWLRDLPVPDRARARRATNISRIHGRGGEKLRANAEARRLTRVRAAQASVEPVDDRTLFFVGLALYWAEGAKDKPWRRYGQVSLINSDLSVLALYLAWLDLLGIPEEARTYRLNIHETADVGLHEHWWASRLGIPLASFARASLKTHTPRTVRHNQGEYYHGCLVVNVRRCRSLYDAIDGWWQGLARSLEPPSEHPDAVLLGSNDPGSSNGRTLGFGPSNRGSSPCPGATGSGSSPWLPARWWETIAPVALEDNANPTAASSECQ